MVLNPRWTNNHILKEALELVLTTGSKPISFSIVILVAKAHSDTIVGVGPNLLDEAIVLLSNPFVAQKFSNGITAFHKTGPISPFRIHSICHFNLHPMCSCERQIMLSVVYSYLTQRTLSASLVFHPFSAIRTFFTASSYENGGTGGLISTLGGAFMFHCLCGG